MTKLDSILKSRDITLSRNVHLVKTMVFPVVMYGCESWTIKKAEHRRIDAFELWCWRRLLRVPWSSRRYNQYILGRSVLGVHWKDWCWSWNSNTLATWCEELTHLKRPWCWERLMGGGEGDDRGWDGWMASSTQWTWVWVDSGSWWWTGRPGVLWLMGCQSRTQLSDWTELPVIVFVFNKIWPALNIINYKMFPIQTNPYQGVWSFENEVREFSSICKGVWRTRNQKNKKVITGFSCIYFF